MVELKKSDAQLKAKRAWRKRLEEVEATRAREARSAEEFEAKRAKKARKEAKVEAEAPTDAATATTAAVATTATTTTIATTAVATSSASSTAAVIPTATAATSSAAPLPRACSYKLHTYSADGHRTDIVEKSVLLELSAAPLPGGFEDIHSAYGELGPARYYEAHGDSYRNPHEPQLAAALALALGEWEALLLPPEEPLQHGAARPGLRVLDLACGSGEVSLALSNWPASTPSTSTTSTTASTATATATTRCVLEAADPHTAAAYERRTGRAAHGWSFADIAGGLWQREARPVFDLVVCSYALHLLDAEALGATLRAVAQGAAAHAPTPSSLMQERLQPCALEAAAATLRAWAATLRTQATTLCSGCNPMNPRRAAAARAHAAQAAHRRRRLPRRLGAGGRAHAGAGARSATLHSATCSAQCGAQCGAQCACSGHDACGAHA